MKNVKKILLCSLSALLVLSLSGCGKKADESKPLSEVTAEANKMNVEQLKKTAMAYKDAITAKKADVEKLVSKLKDVPVAEMLGKEAAGLKTDIENLNNSVSALRERFQIYYDKLKEKGGDVSGLSI